MSAERDKVAAVEHVAIAVPMADALRRGEGISPYVIAATLEGLVEALASARRLGAEEMRERCAAVCEERSEIWRRLRAETETTHGAVQYGAQHGEAKGIASAIRALPLPPEVEA
jgi:hypothetical protein